MPESFVLIKNISNEIILGMTFFWHIYPTTSWNETGITGTFEGTKIRIDFISQPFSKFVNEVKDMISLKNEIDFL